MSESNKILVVDDEAVIRELLSDIMSDEGYTVETAPSAFDALDILNEQDDFVLMFTDILMPKMDGIQLIREARKIRPSLIPIVMTGYATIETARAAIKEGAYDYVLKPFSLNEIKLAINNAFERHRLSAENARLREINELFNTSEKIAAIHDERALLDFVLTAALEQVGAERGSVMLTTPDGRALEVAAAVGLPSEASGERVQIGEHISGWVAQNVRPLLVSDDTSKPEGLELIRHIENTSFISVPLERKVPNLANRGTLLAQPRVLAVMNVCKKSKGDSFTESDLKVLIIIANHAAAAIENARLILDLQGAHLSTLQSMALLLEARDSYTHGHSQRVRDYSMLAAERLGLSREELDVISLAAPLHDLGKVGVNDGTLNKMGKLNDEEWEQIKQHPVIGFDVLSPVRFLEEKHLLIVRHHHERIDGTGYPDGLKGDELPMATRVTAVADAFDAMSSSRAYRKTMSPERIIEELEKCSATQFDPDVVTLFVKLIKDGRVPFEHE